MVHNCAISHSMCIRANVRYTYAPFYSVIEKNCSAVVKGNNKSLSCFRNVCSALFLMQVDSKSV